MNTVVRRRIGALRVAVAPIPGLRSVASVLAFDAGQWSEPHGRPGVARLVAQTMLRGTERRSAAEWAEAIDAIGATSRLDVGGHAAFFSGQCLVPDAGAYLRLVAEAVLHPALHERELAVVAGQTLAQLDEDTKDTRAVADSTWRALAYPAGHPFHTRATGDRDVVRTATAAELRAFHRGSVLGGRPHLVIAGGIEAEAAFDAAATAFGEWPAEERASDPAQPLSPIAGALRRDVVVPDKTQADIVLGWHGLPRTDPRFVAARVTNMVFAQDTFASRAGNVVRDQLGLAYYVSSSLGAGRGPTPWVVRMGVNPQNVERAIVTTLEELRKIEAGDIADDDLALAKDKLVGELDVALESPGGVAQLILEAELFDLGPDHFDRYPRDLRAVTKEQIVETSRLLLPVDRFALAVAGPRLGA